MINFFFFFYVIKVGNKKLKKLSIHLLTACFLKKKSNTSFSNLFVFYLSVFFLFIIESTKAKKASNTSLLYSFSIIGPYLFSFYLLYNKKNLLRIGYCVNLTETCYSTCILLLFC